MLSARHKFVIVSLVASAVLFAISLNTESCLGTPISHERLPEAALAHVRGADATTQPRKDDFGEVMQEDCGDRNSFGIEVGQLRCLDRDAQGNYMYNARPCIACELTYSSNKTHFDETGQDPGYRLDGVNRTCGKKFLGQCNGLGQCASLMADPDFPFCENTYEGTEPQD